MRVAFGTLGCKLNQLETEAMAESFRASGAEVLAFAEPGADLYVLNTCTVTGKAEQKARRMIRAALAANPGAAALATGCWSKLEGAAVEALHARSVAAPGESKDAILGLPRWLEERWGGHGDIFDALREWQAEASGAGRRADPFAFNPGSAVFRTRPALKIQDGCDNRCAYCRVCIARGPSRSLPAAEALRRARALEASGRAEIVLTGVNVSQYRDGELGFPALLRLLSEGTESISFRISSYEPDRVDAEFLEAFSHPRVRPHLHLSVQSASDPILARMGRAYRREGLERAVELARAAKGDPFLAADMIAGFPGESEEDFEASLGFARAAGFAWIHAFPFSPRPGTRAATLPGRVPERVAGERVAALGALAREGRAAYVARWIGREAAAVLEGPPFATTENYLKVSVAGLPADARAGRSFRCRLAPLPADLRGGDPGPRDPEAPGDADCAGEVALW